MSSLVLQPWDRLCIESTWMNVLSQHSWLFFVALVGSLALRCSSMVVRQTMYSVDAVRTDPEFGSTTFPYMFPTFVLALFAKILYAIWPPKGSFYVMFWRPLWFDRPGRRIVPWSFHVVRMFMIAYLETFGLSMDGLKLYGSTLYVEHFGLLLDR